MRRTIRKPAPAMNQLDQLIATIETAQHEVSLHRFLRDAWPVIEPGSPFVDSWHIGAICEHLQAVTAGEIRDLIINIPPRMSKSTIVSVAWPAWEWAQNPRIKWLFTSYAQALAIRDNVRMRRLIESPWYQVRYPLVKLTDDQNQKVRYDTTAGGYRLAVSFGGSATGEGGNRRVIDDPHSADDVHSETKREGALQWWQETWSTRTIDPKRDTEVVIMQRLHERDLSGYLLDEIGGFEHLRLPMEYEPAYHCTTALGWEDPRTKKGELLSPERFPPETVTRLTRRLGSFGAAGQLQQRPAPAGGGIFKTAWWRYWQPTGVNLGPVRVPDTDGNIIEIKPKTIPPGTPDHAIQSWDLAFKDTDGSSLVAGGIWKQWGADAYMIDMIESRLDFIGTLASIREMTKRYPEIYKKVVEDKANGPAVMSVLKSELGGFIPAQPYGSKEARAMAQTPRVEAGNVYLPHPKLYAWVESARGALAAFPATTRSDIVDQLTQALNHLPWNAISYAESRTRVQSTRRDAPRR